MKKNVIKIIIAALLFIVLSFACVTVTSYLYSRNHIMSYVPDSLEEERLLADDFGVSLDSEMHVDRALFSYMHPNNEDRYAIRITGVDDIYSFMSSNVSLDGDITIDNGTIFINGNPIVPNSRVINYEGTQEYNGVSIQARIWGGHGVRSDGPFRFTLTFTFFFLDDELVFVECGCRSGAPFGNNLYNGLLKDYYWRDYVFYPIRPLF